MENICISGVSLDVLDIFEYHVLVQDPVTMAVFLVEYDQIEPIGAVKCDDPDDISNVISLRGWNRWPRSKDTDKRKVKKVSSRPKVLPIAR